MKNVLIIGASSYIGKSFLQYACNKFNIQAISVRDNRWKEFDFSSYDTVLYCAGIAHVPQRKDMRKLYFDVNCNLTAQVAIHAKEAGVKQFIFLSSMSVYGNGQREISPETIPLTKTDDFYGTSKLAAEEKLAALESNNFGICILRPPMVYGYGCKGNFPRLVRLAKRAPFFPDIQNKRSMIYINNLCEFICQTIIENKSGIFLPQNLEYVNTTQLVLLIAKNNGRKIHTTKLFNPLIKLLQNKIGLLDKLFGNLTYTKTGNETEYNIVSFENSVK